MAYTALQHLSRTRSRSTTGIVLRTPTRESNTVVFRSIFHSLPLLHSVFLEQQNWYRLAGRQKMDACVIFHLNSDVRGRSLECAAALRQNTGAKVLMLFDEHTATMEEESVWAPWWNAISNHPVLASIYLIGAGPIHLSRALAAIAKSSSIKKVKILRVVVKAKSLSTFFPTTMSVTRLHWVGSSFEGTLNREEAAHLSASMADNTSIKVMKWQDLEPLHLPVVAWALPKMKYLRTLYINVQQQQDTTAVRGHNAMLLQALKRNSSLLDLTASLWEAWSEADTAKMAFYCERNKQILAILEAPKTTIVKRRTAWPRFFRAVRGCEVEASVLFAALTACGDGVGRRLPENAEKQKPEGPD
jgi:hypothetical protein